MLMSELVLHDSSMPAFFICGFVTAVDFAVLTSTFSGAKCGGREDERISALPCTGGRGGGRSGCGGGDVLKAAHSDAGGVGGGGGAERKETPSSAGGGGGSRLDR